MQEQRPGAPLLGWLQALVRRWQRRHRRAPPAPDDWRGLAPFAVVTGGTRGIGRALAAEFLRHGADVLLVARDERDLERTARDFAGAGMGRVHCLSADLTDDHGPRVVEQRLEELGGYADVLVNNAGMGLSGPYAGQDIDAINTLVDLNVRSAGELMRRLLPGMLERGRGGVLNVASLGGLVPGPYQAAYYASKAYLISLSEAISHEVAGRGVRICVLAPGPVDTDFHERMGSENARYIRFHGVMEAGTVARAGYRGFVWGQTLIVPGLIPKLSAVALRFMPRTLMVPFVAWLLKTH